jgi:hypothetical protein
MFKGALIMNRRGFLGYLAAIAGTTVAPLPVVDTVPVKLLPAIVPVKYSILTELYMSHQAMEDIRNWSVYQTDEVTRKEIYTGGFNP